MIKSYVITIDEIDNPTKAAEIFKKELEGITLLSNTLGIVSTHSDAVYSGVYDAICKASPFPLTGITCGSQIANGQIGAYIFSITLLTGDNFHFVCGHTESISESKKDGAILSKERYLSLRADMSEIPNLALMYTPFAENRFTGEYIDAITAVSPELPMFGGVASSKSTYDDPDGNPQNGNLTLCGGEIFTDSAVIVLISGDFAPKFFVSSFTEDAFLAENIGVVTKCDKNKLKEINCVNATDFLKKFGFDENIESSYSDINEGLMAVTFVLDCGIDCEFDCGDDCDVANHVLSRAPVEINDKEVVCAGIIKEGAHISIAMSTPTAVIDTATEMIDNIISTGGATALIYSCSGRQVGLYTKPMEELEMFNERLTGKVNYSAVYTGGEICPTCVNEHRANNNEHNQTLVACVLV
ncbi:MAG: FIST C-terminal domain-containing protein [Oscillospiraceae bacterium]|nr:FIST C-terminal domain-containing protein [Oscillospiraceae bacterium]